MSATEGITIPIVAEDEFSEVFSAFTEESSQLSSSIGEVTSSTEGLSEASTSMSGAMEEATSSASEYSSSAQNVATSTSSMSEAQDSAAESIALTNDTAEESSSGFQENATQAAAVGGAIGGTSMAVIGLSDSYTQLNDAQLRYNTAANNEAKSEETLAYDKQKLQDAQDKLNALVDAGVTSGTKYTAAQTAVASAQQTVNNASTTLTNSQNTLQQAQNRLDLANERVQTQWLMMGTSVVPMLLTQIPTLTGAFGGIKDAITGADTAAQAMNAAILENAGATEEEITSLLGLEGAETEGSIATDGLAESTDAAAISSDAMSVSEDAQAASTGIASGAMTIFNAVMDANPIGIVVLAITALVAIIGVATGGFKNWTPVINAVNTAFNDLKTAGQDLYNFFAPIFETDIKTWETALNDLWDVIKPIVQGIKDISGGISTVSNAVTGGLNSAGSAITGALSHLASGGIVSEPTVALVGESGPEAVIPLEDTSTQSILAPLMPAISPIAATHSISQTNANTQSQSTYSPTINFQIAGMDSSSDYDWQNNINSKLQKVVQQFNATT